jgi:hypothetical protein
MRGQFPHFFQTALAQVKAQSTYYLLFGRQTDQTGVNTKIWVALNLPKTGVFSCMSALELSISSDKIYTVCNSNLRSGVPSSAVYAEIEAMQALKAIVADAVACCSSPNLRNAEECRSSLVDEFYKQKFTLNSVSFLNTQPIKNDDDQKPYEAPHWQKDLGRSNEKPVLYLHNQTIQINVKFDYKDALEANASVFVQGRSASGFNIPSTKATINTASNTLEILNVAFAQPLPAGVNYFEKFTMEWEVSIDEGKTWGKVGVSKNPLYVIVSPSQNAYRVYETLFFIGCKSAKGKTNPDDIFAAIWSHFASLGVKNAKNKPLKYYGDPFTQIIQTVDLITQCNGQCGSFASLFLDVLDSQGIGESTGSNYVKFYSLGGEAEDKGFLVNDWEFPAEPNQSGNSEYPYYNLPYDSGGGITLDPRGFAVWGEGAAVIDQEGVKGQNNANPKAIFSNHQVVLYKGKYYDPSYGKVYNSLQEISEQAIAGFYIEGTIRLGDTPKPAYFFQKNSPGLKLDELKSRK